MFGGLFGKKEEAPPAPQEKAPAVLAPPVPEEAQQVIPSLVNERTSWNPGRFDEMNRECKSIINPQEAFEGVRFDCTRNFRDIFTATHVLSMGGAEPPSYGFATTFVKQPFVLHSKIDADGVLNGRVHLERGRYATRLGFQISNDAGQSGVNLETEYVGRDFTFQGKWQNPSTFVLSYLQSITKRISLGCEMYSSIKQGNHGLSFAARYEDAKSVGYIAGVPGMISLNYVHKLSPSLCLAGELAAQQTPRGTESSMSWGADIRYRASAWRTNVDSTGRVACIYEEGLSPNTKVTFSAESDIINRKYKFGFGLSVSA